MLEEQKLRGCFKTRKRMWVGTQDFPARQEEGHRARQPPARMEPGG